jgi:hypothetical protein
MEKGVYTILIKQPGNPKNCKKGLTVSLIGGYSPLHMYAANNGNKGFMAQAMSGNSQPHQTRIMQSQHEAYTGAIKSALSMPVNLNSYKYLGSNKDLSN